MISKNQIKYLRSLSQIKFRRDHGRFIAEGPKIAAELPSPDIRVDTVYGLEEWVNANGNKFADARIEVVQVTAKELERISSLSNSNQVVALCRIPERNISELSAEEGILLVLDGIRDPGNLGTIVRTADWFGINNIICSTDCVDLYNPKTIQSTMGSFARVKVFYTDLPAFLSGTDQKVYATVMDAEPIWQAMPGEGIYIIGNESHGIRPEVMQLANQQISIPAAGKAESLNAAVAAGIVMGIATKS